MHQGEIHSRFRDIVEASQVILHTLKDDGVMPNNEKLPLLVYQAAFALPQDNPAAAIEAVFEANGWSGCWRNGVYSFHHYHSTAHEVLGVYSGTAQVQFGGENGPIVSIKRGDVAIIPAGVGHKNLGASTDFRVVGAYPNGQRPDLKDGQPNERPRADENIARVPLPDRDAVYGGDGPLIEHWGSEIQAKKKDRRHHLHRNCEEP